MAFVHLSDLKDYDALSTASRSTVSSGFRVKNPKKLPRLNDRWSSVTCSGCGERGKPCRNRTLNRSGFCHVHETPEARCAAFLLMCDEALEALETEELPKIPEIPIPEPIIKDPIPDKPIVKEIPTATPVNQVNIQYNLSGLMKQINIFIALILFAMYMYGKSMHASDELVCLPAPHAAPAPPSVMLGW
jgi:hypothetical protein